MSYLQIRPVITLEQIIRSKPTNFIWSSRTCWWTHTEEDMLFGPLDVPAIAGDLKKLSGKLPVDATGAPLWQAENGFRDFLNAALKKIDNYGKHGLTAFLSAHKRNAFTNFHTDPALEKPAAFASWDIYNEALDRYISQHGKIDLIGNIKNWRRWK